MLFCSFLFGWHNQHLKMLQEFWSTMDEIDKVLWVVDATKPTYAMSHRLLALGIFLVSLEVTVVYYYLSLLKLPYVAWHHQVMIAIFYCMLTHTSPAPYQSKASFQDSIPSQPWLHASPFFQVSFLGCRWQTWSAHHELEKKSQNMVCSHASASHCAQLLLRM